ncbi:hypothetical protein CHA01nite_17410 [Chryseobacterium hagamense]|uniref:Uncharacterized protein n=1 Tax=Chryseobacterium hagamense TaxID=395935 RepID=A0A511YLD2_9FLAO|nr:hypothetical protein CHA01nite_17410 [Chryseobacterium hagamense]
MCNDGDWLKGESNVFKNEKGSSKIRWETSGFAKENFKGTAIKKMPAITVTKSIRQVNIFNWYLSLHEKNTMQKKSPPAMYGMIDRGTNGIDFSKPKVNDGTSSKEDAYQVQRL